MSEGPWIKHLDPIAQRIIEVVKNKDAEYGGSWQQRGGRGAYFMLARKWDRIQNITQDGALDLFELVSENTADIVDDIDDLIGYLLLVRGRQMEQKAEARPQVVNRLATEEERQKTIERWEELKFTPIPRIAEDPFLDPNNFRKVDGQEHPFGYNAKDEVGPASSVTDPEPIPRSSPKHRPLSGN